MKHAHEAGEKDSRDRFQVQIQVNLTTGIKRA